MYLLKRRTEEPSYRSRGAVLSKIGLAEGWMVDGAAWKLHWVSSWTRSSWSSFGSSVPRRQSAGAEHSAVQVTH